MQRHSKRNTINLYRLVSCFIISLTFFFFFLVFVFPYFHFFAPPTPPSSFYRLHATRMLQRVKMLLMYSKKNHARKSDNYKKMQKRKRNSKISIFNFTPGALFFFLFLVWRPY